MSILKEALFNSEGFKNIREIGGISPEETIVPMGEHFAIMGNDAQIKSYFNVDQNGFVNFYDADFNQVKKLTSVSKNQIQMYDMDGSISNTVFLNELGGLSYNLDFESEAISLLSDSLDLDESSILDTFIDVSDLI